MYSTDDSYSAVYEHGVVAPQSTLITRVMSWSQMTGYAKAGIMVRNSIAGSGSTPEGVILFASPAGGIQMEWDDDGGDFVNSDTPGNGSIPASLPVWLKLVRNGPVYTGYYSDDGTNWDLVGTANLPSQLTFQDAGMFMVRHAEGSPGQVVFDGLRVT